MKQPKRAGPPRMRGEFHVDEETRDEYSGASGILTLVPRAVAVPRDAADVATLVRWAAKSGAALVPRAAGTGMPGGNLGGGVSVDVMRHFRAIPVVDPVMRRATLQPGVTLAELNQQAAAHGLHLPVDPSSGARCTLGGMIANNSAGAHSVCYGAMRPWVAALDVVLADGTLCTLRRGEMAGHPRLRRILSEIDAWLLPEREQVLERWPNLRKNSSGYALKEYLESGDALDLLIGSEGTLALVVGAEVRLAPLPEARGLALLEFTTLEAAGEAVRAILPLGPATCEMLDRTFIELVRTAGVEAGYPLREGLEALLLVEMEGDSESAVREKLNQLERAAAGLAAHVSLARDEAEMERFWHVRHAVSPLIAQRTDGRVSMQFIEDGVVPVDRLPDYVRALREVLGAHGVPAVIFGHAGDGNLHVNPLVDVSAAGWQADIESILGEMAGRVAALGGTMTGEHGDGRLRAPLLETIWGAEMVARFRRVKHAFDPAGILNPGVILPLPGQRPLEALRAYAGGARSSSTELTA